MTKKIRPVNNANVGEGVKPQISKVCSTGLLGLTNTLKLTNKPMIPKKANRCSFFDFIPHIPLQNHHFQHPDGRIHANHPKGDINRQVKGPLLEFVYR